MDCFLSADGRILTNMGIQGHTWVYKGMHGYTGYTRYAWLYMGIQGIQGIPGYTGYTGYTWAYRVYKVSRVYMALLPTPHALNGGDISNGRRHIAWIVSEPGFYSQQETVQMEWQSGKPKRILDF